MSKIIYTDELEIYKCNKGHIVIKRINNPYDDDEYLKEYDLDKSNV